MEWPTTPELLAFLGYLSMGIALAASAGLRAFLPPLVVGLAARFELIELGPGFAWLAETPALIVFGVAMVLELVADKIPVVDHVLDSVQLAIKPAMGGIVMGAALIDGGPLLRTVLALAAGGSVAVTVHGAKAALRALSTVATGGMANPVLSFAEDASSLAGSLLAVLLPIVALVLLAILGLLAVWLGRSLLRRSSAAAGRPPTKPHGSVA
jgi:hypothetical protein